MAEYAFPLLQGMPDDMRAAVELSPNRELKVSVPGSALFHTRLPAALQPRLRRVLIDANNPLQLPSQASGRPVVNYIADPDLCSHALEQVARLVDALRAPCFNHPDALRRTSRHALSRLLRGLPGLQVPRTELIDAPSSIDLVAQIERHGLRYPLLLRVPGMHVGATMSKVDDADGVHRAAYDMPIWKRGMYATEFVDFRDADGLYRKLRLAVIGKRVMARHCIAASDWNIHGADRARPDDPDEHRIVDGFPGSLPVDLVPVAQSIADALELDYFGIDCSLRPDGRLLVFEANPAMDIIQRQVAGHDERWTRRVEAISEAFAALLFDPAQWRHQRGGRLP